MIQLTKAEEQLMQYLWELEKAFLKDIVDAYPEPKPAYTTISTVIRTLVNKKVIAYKTFGKSNQYFPKITKEAYFKNHLNNVVKNFFNGSYASLASFFTDNDGMTKDELKELKALIDQKIKKIKK